MKKITTATCKDFIKSAHKLIGKEAAKKWVRVKKYNKDGGVLRDFISESGKTLTIMEKDGIISLHSLGKATAKKKTVKKVIKVKGCKQLKREPEEKDVIKFLIECIKKDKDIIDDEVAQADAESESSWCCDEVQVEDVGFYPTFYKSNLKEKDIYKTYHLFMYDYDTAWRYNVYETMEHKLYISENNPD